MNERILELFQEAIDYADKTHTYTPEEGFNIQVWDKIRFEKFAELIIQECSAVANHFSDGHELDQFGRKMYHYTVDIGQVINEYFGVEE